MDDRQAIQSPPLELEEHIEAEDGADFAERCLSLVKTFDMTRNWQLSTPVVSKSERWGLVWRADFTFVDGGSSFLVNRVVCWETAEGKLAIEIAIGRDLKPLPVSGG